MKFSDFSLTEDPFIENGWSKGKIINSGNHEYLINNSEEYKSLYKNQLK